MKSLLLLCMALALTACSPTNEPDDAAAGAHGPVVAQKPTAVTEPPSVAPEIPAPVLHYQCGDVLVSTQMQTDAMQLSLSGRNMRLPHVPTASGAKYDDGKGNSFLVKGEETALMLAGKEVGSCTKSGHASPWIDAQARGIGFRAVGSEPGWFVEVGHGATPVLHAELDYGERQIDAGRLVPLTGERTGFRGTATDGTSIELRIKRMPCNDSMSGEAFEASAELLVADRPYKGCGAYLFD